MRRFRNGLLIAAYLVAVLTNAVPALAQTVQDVQVGTQSNGATGLGFSANSATNPVYTSPATSGVQTVVAQASTTSGQVGPLNQCAVTTSAPSYTTAQTDPLSCTTGGGLRQDVTTWGGATVQAAAAGQDGNSNGLVIPLHASEISLYNETNWDRQRGNTTKNLLASAAQTTTQTSADQVNYNSRGIHIIVDVTTSGTGSITMTLNGKDPSSGKYYLLLSGLAITSVSTNIYRLYPGITASANANASDILPRTFQIVTTANNANSMTYSVGYNLVN